MKIRLINRMMAIMTAAALITCCIPAEGLTAYAAEQEEAVEAGEASSEALYGNAAGDMLWGTGVAAVGEFVPGGKALGPLLDAFGTLLGVGVDDQPSAEELVRQLKDVSKQIRGLSSQVAGFREEMNERLDKFEREMSDEIEAALNGIKNDIFINGVGSELDTLHTQVSGRNGIARKIDVINSDSSMSDEVKAIETAYLIGDDKAWNETQNALYRFELVGNLLAGKTYRDTKGRNLYQVLYDEAAGKSMMSGEAYKKIEPYIDRTMDEYLYAYTVLTQCLTASLEVSLFTNEQLQKLKEDDVEYDRYLACQVDTDLVKTELDNINKELLNAKDPNSIISLYSAFKHRKAVNGTVYINKGTANINLAADMVAADNRWTGKRVAYGIDSAESARTDQRLDDAVVNEAYQSAYQSDWYSDEDYRGYYQEMSDFVSGGENLGPDCIKNISGHLRNVSPDTSLLDYLGDVGFNASRYQDSDAYFATGDMKTKTSEGTNVSGCEYGFDAVGASGTSGGSSWIAPCSLSMERSGTGGEEEEPQVYATLNDVSYLGLKIVESEDMPETAEEVMAKYSEYTAELQADGSGFELYQKYDIKDIPVSFKDGDGNTVSSDALGSYSDGSHYKVSISGACGGVWSDGASVIFREAGEYAASVSALDPEGRSIVSENGILKCVSEHRSSILTAEQNPVAGAILTLTLDSDGVTDLNEKIAPRFSMSGGEAASVTPIWEAKETPDNGIELDASGTAVFTKKGTFNVRFKGKDANGDYAYGEWNKVVVKDPEECFTMTFHDPDGNELYRITGKEGAAVKPVSGNAGDGYSFAGWDKTEADGKPDGEAEEVPAVMPGEDTKYTALWKREMFDGYEAVSDEASLLKAIASAPASEATYIALENDITVGKLDFPKASGANIFIDGVEHTLSFKGNAVIAPKAGQSLSFEDITLKAGNGKDVKLTAASGGILLDAVGFDCRQAYITAVKGELYLNDVRASNLTVKGGSKQSATVGGNTEVKAVTGFNKVSVEDCFSVIKTLKAPEMKLNGDAVLKVGTGAQVALTKGISGWGEVFLAEDFRPVTLGKGNTGRIRLTADDTLEDKVIFKTKASDLNEVFDVSGIAPQAEDGTYDYGLYVKGGKAYVRAYRWKLNGKTYCEWNDCIKAVASVKPASDATITLLGDIALPGTLKLPARGKYRTLTINGSGHAVIFSGKKVSLTGDLVLRNISLGSTGGAWTLDKGKYSLTGSDYRLTGCSVR